MKKFFGKTNIVFVAAVLGCALAALPSRASAAGGVIAGSGNARLENGDTECSHCPIAPVPAAQFSFAKAEKRFAESAASQSDRPDGDWKLVAVARNPMVGELFNLQREGNYPSGATNADGSDAFWLRFGKDTSDWSEESPATVLIGGLGASAFTQGPNEVSFRDRSACFAQYAYEPWSTKLMKDAYFTYSCRLVKNSKNHMICSMTPNGNASKFTLSQQPWLGRVVQYFGYIKVQ